MSLGQKNNDRSVSHSDYTKEEDANNGCPDLDLLLDLEFALVSLDNSCRCPLLIEEDDFRECRRIKGHKLKHASGFGLDRVQW